MKKISKMDTEDWKEVLESVEYKTEDLDCQCSGGMFGSSGKKCADLGDDDEIKGLSSDMICYASTEGINAYKVVDDKCFTYDNCLELGGGIEGDACVSGDTSSHTFNMTKSSVGYVSIKNTVKSVTDKNNETKSTDPTNKSKSTHSGNHCGIQTCTDDVWDTSIGGEDTCGSRIDHFKSDDGGDLSVKNACSIVANNHPDKCGMCFPEKNRVRGWFKSDLENNAVEFVDQNGVSTFDSLDGCISAAKKSGKKVHEKDIVAMLYRDENHSSMPKTCVAISDTPGWNKTGDDVLRDPYEHETGCLDSTKFIKNGCK